MALADNLGGTATTANLPDGATTTTIESKTNFFAGIPVGDTARAECTPLHRGRSTMVWQTRVTRRDGKLAAIVTQTQLVLTKSGWTSRLAAKAKRSTRWNAPSRRLRAGASRRACEGTAAARTTVTPPS
jgi:acyl-CoA thioesterase FadM